MSVYITKLLRFLPIYLLLMIISTACVSFRESDAKVFRKFKETAVTPKIYRMQFEDKELRYIADKTVDVDLPSIIFIHGAPGSAGNYFRYLKDEELGKKANLISVDRLGYGYSDHGNAVTSIEIQAKSIFAVAEAHKLTNIILVGWSYGVPIAAKMAYLFPQVKHSVLVAGAISPKHEKYFGIAKMAQWKLTKWLVPKPLKMADREKMTHVDELTKMSNDWQKITSPITYYHGTKDKIVPYENMNFIISKVSDTILKAVVLEDMNHFILSKKYGMIKKELLQILENQQLAH
jgi:pimeloyl-ACP methyl ester carboxylesterase